jgi:hypothetical protein
MPRATRDWFNSARPSSRRENEAVTPRLCPWERLKRVLINVVAVRTMIVGKRRKRLDRVEDLANVGTFGDTVKVGHGLN